MRRHGAESQPNEPRNHSPENVTIIPPGRTTPEHSEEVADFGGKPLPSKEIRPIPLSPAYPIIVP